METSEREGSKVSFITMIVELCTMKLFCRYSPSSLPIYPNCNHNSQSYQCRTLSMGDVLNFHKAFYSSKHKISQDNFILKYCNSTTTKRNRPTTGTRTSKNIAIKYHVRSKQTGDSIPVCRNAFLGILLLTKNRVNGVVKRNFISGEVASETRGGDRHSKNFAAKSEAVIEFIKKFKPVESHYCRGKSN